MYRLRLVPNWLGAQLPTMLLSTLSELPLRAFEGVRAEQQKRTHMSKMSMLGGMFPAASRVGPWRSAGKRECRSTLGWLLESGSRIFDGRR
mmetsp:Transcript_22066/g.48238  ORF Transcript_22066/g.48238 Transcript_22066/m.48238 type:complete len:91 (-) Transcript_22066:326-598(-)